MRGLYLLMMASFLTGCGAPQVTSTWLVAPPNDAAVGHGPTRVIAFADAVSRFAAQIQVRVSSRVETYAEQTENESFASEADKVAMIQNQSKLSVCGFEVERMLSSYSVAMEGSDGGDSKVTEAVVVTMVGGPERPKVPVEEAPSKAESSEEARDGEPGREGLSDEALARCAECRNRVLMERAKWDLLDAPDDVREAEEAQRVSDSGEAGKSSEDATTDTTCDRLCPKPSLEEVARARKAQQAARAQVMELARREWDKMDEGSESAAEPQSASRIASPNPAWKPPTVASDVRFMVKYFRSFESASEATERGEWTEFGGEIGGTLLGDGLGLTEAIQHAEDHGCVVSEADVAGQAFTLIRFDVSKVELPEMSEAERAPELK